MATNDLLSKETIRQHVGQTSYNRGRAYANKKLVKNSSWNKSAGVLRGQVRGSAIYSTTVTLKRKGVGNFGIVSSACSCPVGQRCKHVAALLLSNLHLFTKTAEAPKADIVPSRTPSKWRQDLLGFMEQPVQAPKTGTQLGLVFELTEQYLYSSATVTTWKLDGKQQVLGVRPVYTSGDGDRWKMSDLTWLQISRGYTYVRDIDQQQFEWMAEFHRLYTTGYPAWYENGRWVFMDCITNPTVWSLLERGQQLGIGMIQAQKSQPSLKILPAATASLDITRKPSGNLTLHPVIQQNGTVLSGDHSATIGRAQAIGMYLWQLPGAVLKEANIAIAPFNPLPSKPLQAMLAAGMTTTIPKADVESFMATAYPIVSQQVPLTSADNSIELPKLVPPTLIVEIAPDENTLRLALHWQYKVDKRTHKLGLYPASTDKTVRQSPTEHETMDRLGAVLQPYPSCWENANSMERLAPKVLLSGMEAVAFAENGLKSLQEIPNLEVRLSGELPDYRELTAEPEIIIGTKDSDEQDWFDLHIQVKLDGQEVPFDALLIALANQDPFLVLPDGRYFGLDREEFHKLRSLLEEARKLDDSSGEGLKLSRFQAGLWEDLVALGVVSEQAAAWQEAVNGLLNIESVESVALPGDLTASLRPYQDTGYQWLHFLWRHQLGGILADDMGLGKTIQTICLIAKAAETKPDARWLVVAPTSVMGNWQQECERFAPHLQVKILGETSKKRGQLLADSIQGAQVVVTSYTLLRLDEDEFQAERWEGIVLDEAQFIKNHQSKSYQVVRKLRGNVKIGLSGTPLENNLMELWALLSVVAPGLFASPKHFDEFYQKPITRENNADRLQQLKHRIRPLLLRRTKQEVMADLPPKIEQTLKLSLLPAHQKIYDLYLQRERQRVLGLLGDMQKNRLAIFKSLTTLRLLSLDARLIDPKKYQSVASTKLDALLEQLTTLADEGHRALIFSQFTSYLKLVKERLDEAGYGYYYLDGKTKNRATVVKNFQTGKLPFFVISLKSGGFGLNLTQADYCFLLDPWWNPAVEAQAIDRTHRIGQTKPVSVYRLIAKGTIEEKVVALRERKAKLFGSIMEEDSAFSGTLTADDIRGLFE